MCGGRCRERPEPVGGVLQVFHDLWSEEPLSGRAAWWLGATVSHMEVGVRELRNDTGRVIDAVRAGERVTLTVRGEPVADIVPHGVRTRWLSGAALRDQLRSRAADPGLRSDLDQLAGETLAEL